jgi:hypothetical protein
MLEKRVEVVCVCVYPCLVSWFLDNYYRLVSKAEGEDLSADWVDEWVFAD